MRREDHLRTTKHRIFWGISNLSSGFIDQASIDFYKKSKWFSPYCYCKELQFGHRERCCSTTIPQYLHLILMISLVVSLISFWIVKTESIFVLLATSISVIHFAGSFILNSCLRTPKDLLSLTRFIDSFLKGPIPTIDKLDTLSRGRSNDVYFPLNMIPLWL